MLFAAAASAGLYGWIAAVLHLAASPIEWAPAVFYVLLGAAATFAAYRLFQASVGLNARLKAAEDLSSLSDNGHDPTVSVWSEAFGRNRRVD